MYIEVTHSRLKNSVKDVENYVNTMRKFMNSTGDKVNDLVSKDWKHDDALEFKSQWLKHNDPSSVTYRMRATLSCYANSLKYAEEEYKKAQSRAINRANMLF